MRSAARARDSLQHDSTSNDEVMTGEEGDEMGRSLAHCIFAGGHSMLRVIHENYGNVFGRDCYGRAILLAHQQVVESSD